MSNTDPTKNRRWIQVLVIKGKQSMGEVYLIVVWSNLTLTWFSPGTMVYITKSQTTTIIFYLILIQFVLPNKLLTIKKEKNQNKTLQHQADRKERQSTKPLCIKHSLMRQYLLRSSPWLAYRFRISVSQMTTDMFHWS